MGEYSTLDDVLADLRALRDYADLAMRFVEGGQCSNATDHIDLCASIAADLLEEGHGVEDFYADGRFHDTRAIANQWRIVCGMEGRRSLRMRTIL